jgi:four helix bundle protein
MAPFRAAVPEVVGVRRFEDLVAWQLAVELCDVVFEITETGAASSDLEFRSQIRKAAQKAPALIAEGFLRYTPSEFVPYLRVARGEIGEVQNHLVFASRHKYWSPKDLDRASALARRTMIITTRLLKSKLPQGGPGTDRTQSTNSTQGTNGTPGTDGTAGTDGTPGTPGTKCT